MTTNLNNTNLQWLKHRILYVTRHGSRAYGTNTATSDVDLRGIAVPTLDYFFGFQNRFGHTDLDELTAGTGDDVTIYGLQKFMELAAKANPNMLELLWTEPEDRLVVHPLMNKIFDKRDLFLSKRVAHTFSGYAISQLKKLERSRVRPPERTNPVRAELIAKFGYDTKDAMHVVRLLRMGMEILETGKVLVRRPDAEELLAIRAGAWSLDKILIYAKRRDEELKILAKKSKLPHDPDIHALDQLCLEVTQASFNAYVQMPTMAGGWGTQEMTYGAGRLVPKILSTVGSVPTESEQKPAAEPVQKEGA